MIDRWSVFFNQLGNRVNQLERRLLQCNDWLSFGTHLKKQLIIQRESWYGICQSVTSSSHAMHIMLVHKAKLPSRWVKEDTTIGYENWNERIDKMVATQFASSQLLSGRHKILTRHGPVDGHQQPRTTNRTRRFRPYSEFDRHHSLSHRRQRDVVYTDVHNTNGPMAYQGRTEAVRLALLDIISDLKTNPPVDTIWVENAFERQPSLLPNERAQCNFLLEQLMLVWVVLRRGGNLVARIYSTQTLFMRQWLLLLKLSFEQVQIIERPPIKQLYPPGHVYRVVVARNYNAGFGT
jgi:hypothetical protein